MSEEDEVKVFRREDNEEIIEGAEQLQNDKQEIAYEAEVETASSFGTPMPNPVNVNSGIASMIAMTSPYFSPAYIPMMALSPQYQTALLVSHQRRAAAMYQQQAAAMNLFQPSSSSAFAQISTPPTPKSAPGPIKTPKSTKENRSSVDEKPKVHIKKPLNAFMIFMKENRPKLLEQEGNATKQSAELNAVLGKMWQELPEDEQKKYYEKATVLKEEHSRLYPGWSARDNYAIHKKKKAQRKQDRSNNENIESKKCRARFGIDNQDRWCRHCKRKKRCLNVCDDGEHSSSSGDTSPPTPGSMDLPDVHGAGPTQGLPSSQFPAPQSMFPGGMSNFGMMPSPFGFGMNPFTFPFNFTPPVSNAPIVHPSSLIPKTEGTETATVTNSE